VCCSVLQCVAVDESSKEELLGYTTTSSGGSVSE